MLRFFSYISDKLKGLDVVSKEKKIILKRRFIINRQNFGLYLHKCNYPDLDPNLFHDHPWSWSFSIILYGYYIEERPGFGQEDEKRKKRFLNLNILGKNTFHRLSEISKNGVWTLYFRGKRAKKDGFLLRQENGHWKHILASEADFEFKETKK